MEEKTLHNSCTSSVVENVSDVIFWGDPKKFELISKASSKKEGWMKSTKAMEVGNDVVIQVTTQQRNPDGTYSIAEALTTVKNIKIVEIVGDGEVVGRDLESRI